MAKDAKSLKQAIENLSKKSHVINEEAKQAKEKLDDIKDDLVHFKYENKNMDQPHSFRLIDELNDSINLLARVFKKSNFDSFAYLLSNPARLVILNFLSGLIKGLGFALGMFIIFIIVLALFLDNLSPATLKAIALFLKSI
jgi:hypothetical protein